MWSQEELEEGWKRQVQEKWGQARVRHQITKENEDQLNQNEDNAAMVKNMATLLMNVGLGKKNKRKKVMMKLVLSKKLT